MLDYIPQLKDARKEDSGVSINTVSIVDKNIISTSLLTLTMAQPNMLIANISDSLACLEFIQLGPMTSNSDTDSFNDILENQITADLFSSIKEELTDLNNTILFSLYGSLISPDDANKYDGEMLDVLLTMEKNGEKINYESLAYSTKLIKMLYEYSEHVFNCIRDTMSIVNSTAYYFNEDKKQYVLSPRDAEVLSYDSMRRLSEQCESIKYVFCNHVPCNLFKACYNLIIEIDGLKSIETSNECQDKAVNATVLKLKSKFNIKFKELLASTEYCRQQFLTFNNIFYERNELIKSFYGNINNKNKKKESDFK